MSDRLKNVRRRLLAEIEGHRPARGGRCSCARCDLHEEALALLSEAEAPRCPHTSTREADHGTERICNDCGARWRPAFESPPAAAAPAPPQTCVWRYDMADGVWTSQCGQHEVATDSRYVYCPFCAKLRDIDFTAPAAGDAGKETR